MRSWTVGLIVVALVGCSGTDQTRTGSGHGAGAGSNSGSSGGSFNFNVSGGALVNGSGGSTSTAGTIPENGCTEVEITPMVMRSPGNLLVIFDRSFSMTYNFFPIGSSTTRFQAVDAALQEGLMSFVCPPQVTDQAGCVETLTVGSILLPSADLLGCAPVDPIEASTQIFWKPVSEFLNDWQAYWAGPPNNVFPLGTPIEEAFQKGNLAITTYWPSQLTGSMAVLFLTDGESTCSEIDPARPAVDAIQQATMWNGMGINTYVVSVANAQAAFNDQVAAAGGTGTSINPSDTAALSSAIANVIQQTSSVTSCTATLGGQAIADIPKAYERGVVRVGTADVPADPTNGYQITSPTEITLFGSACDALKNGLPLSAKFPCDVLQ